MSMRVIVAAVLATGSGMPHAAAQTAQEKADFELVQKIDTRKAYEIFLSTYPNGYYAETVRSRIKETTGADPRDPRLQPNWGDGIFIQRLMDKQK
jgi:hypothetical protein